MEWKRATTFACAAVLLFGTAGAVFAQDAEGEDDAPMIQPAGVAADADDDAKPGFWGDFSLFVEAATGSASVDPINTSLQTGPDLRTDSTFDLGDVDYTRAAIGWKLPFDRGSFELIFTGYKEDQFEFTSVGSTSSVVGPTDEIQLTDPVPWWNVAVADGQLLSEQFPPFWDPAVNDTNGNTIPDPGEFVIPTIAAISTSRPTNRSMQNQFQTIDLVYRRGWGGPRLGGRWFAGARYFNYEGNLLATAWLTGSGQSAGGVGFTDGSGINLMAFSQDTTGGGPVGSLGVFGRFFRERLELYGDVGLAFVLAKTEAESNRFSSLLGDPLSGGALLTTASGRISEEIDKDVWHVMSEVGLNWGIVGGLSLNAAYYVYGFHDAVVVATDLSVPENPTQINRGAAALFTTTDFRFDGYRLGLKYQF